MITKMQALEALENMDDYARMANIEPTGAYNALKKFIEEHYQDSLRWKSLKEQGLDIGRYHPSYEYCNDAWFEYYTDQDIDTLILEEYK